MLSELDESKKTQYMYISDGQDVLIWTPADAEIMANIAILTPADKMYRLITGVLVTYNLR